MDAYSITAETASVEETLRELSTLADSTDLPLDVVNRLIDFLNLGLEVSGVESIATLGASELRIGLKVPDGLLELVSALRAGNFNSGALV
jgi:hypothetical protein